METEREIKELVKELTEATGFTLNDSLDDEVEYDSLGLEVPSGGQGGGKSAASDSNGGILGKLIKEKSRAILSTGYKAEIEQAVE